MVQMIKDVGLPHKKTELSSSLSGKEKLEITDTASYKVIKDVSFFFLPKYLFCYTCTMKNLINENVKFWYEINRNVVSCKIDIIKCSE